MQPIFPLLALLLLFGFLPNADAQSDPHWKLGTQAMGFTVHPFKTSRPDRYPLKLDPNGYFVVTPGIVLHGDWYYNPRQRSHLRIAAAWYLDSGLNHAGYAHIGYRYSFLKKERWEMSAGLGPAFFIRQNGNYIYPDRNRSDPFYGDRETRNRLFQYRWFVGGELDLIYRLNDRWDLDFSLVPGYPAAIVMKGGVRFALEKSE